MFETFQAVSFRYTIDEQAELFKMRKIFYFLPLLALALPHFSCANSSSSGGEAFSTGPCTYTYYDGKAEIVSIKKVEPGKTTVGGPSYEQYEAKFVFTTDQTLPEPYRNLKAKEHPLLLTNSWHPGPKFLQKYGIEVGKIFPCTLGIIQTGTCTPVVFQFPGIDRSDYFENADR